MKSFSKIGTFSVNFQHGSGRDELSCSTCRRALLLIKFNNYLIFLIVIYNNIYNELLMGIKVKNKIK